MGGLGRVKPAVNAVYMPLLRLPQLVNTYRRVGTYTSDLNDHFFVFGTVIVNLVWIVNHETTGGKRRRCVKVPFRPCANPPCALENHDLPLLGMKVRRTEGAWRKAHAYDVGARFRWTAVEHSGPK